MFQNKSSIRAVSFGECMIELQGQAFGTMQQSHGGDTLNTAVYLARCGARRGIEVSYATGLGDDGLSGGMMQRWADEGVRLDFVRRLPGRLPGLYLIEVDAQGERRFSYWRDQAPVRSYFDLPGGETPLEAQADHIDALYFSGISLAVLNPAARDRLWAVAHRVRERGACVVFDNNYRPRLWSSVVETREAFKRSMGLASIALLTLDDEQAVWGDDAASGLSSACPEVIIKRGSEPTLVRCKGQPMAEVATVHVPRVVDTTAAGDSFAGAYLAARLAGANATDAARAGNQLAARVVQHRGALIDRAAMADLME